MNLKWLYNPFEYLAGYKSLIYGIAVLSLISYLNYLSGNHYTGIVSIRFAKDLPLKYFAFEILINWVVQVVIFFFLGMVLSKSRIRMIDVAGTFALARIPMIMLALIRFFPFFSSFFIMSVNFGVLVFVIVILSIWIITLLFNAYKVSCNLKGNILIISFIGGILFSEAVSIVAIVNYIPNIKSIIY